MVAESPAPVVVDADGFNALGRLGNGASVGRRRRRSSSPPTKASTRGSSAGPGAGPDRRRPAAGRRASGAVVLLKGPTTVGGRTRRAGSAGRRRVARPWPPPAPATCSPGSSAPSWPAAWPPSRPPPSPPTSTAGPPGSGLAEGLVAGDLPDLVARGLAGPRRPAAGWLAPATRGAAAAGVGGDRPGRHPPQRRGLLPSWPRRPSCARWSRRGPTATAPVRVARAAIDGGATWLAVALVEEGRQLRGGRDRRPGPAAVRADRAGHGRGGAAGLTPTIYTAGRRGRAGRRRGGRQGRPGRSRSTSRWTPACTGWGPPRTRRSARRPVAVHARAGLRACGPTSPWPTSRSRRYRRHRPAGRCFAERSTGWPAVGPAALLHAANSAGASVPPRARSTWSAAGSPSTAWPPARVDGQGPSPATPLRPALSLRARVSFVKEVEAGERLSYGLRYRAHALGRGHRSPRLRRRRHPAPVGHGGQVLDRGPPAPDRRHVTMDQILVDCGPAGRPVEVGDEVVLLGRQGAEEVTATSGPICSAPSATRCCATSDPGSRGS